MSSPQFAPAAAELQSCSRNRFIDSLFSRDIGGAFFRDYRIKTLPGVLVSGIQRQCPAKLIRRFIQLALSVKSDPPIDVRIGVLWIGLKGLLEFLDRFIVPSLSEKNDSQPAVGLGKTWFEF